VALSGTEAAIINSVARLRRASKDQIRRAAGFSLEYIGYLCQYLVRKSYLDFSQGHYSLARAGIKSLLTEESKIDRELIKEVAGEVAREISGELKKTIKGIKIPAREAREIKAREEKSDLEAIKIKTDFDFPVEDETTALKSNIEKIGVSADKEKSDIDKSVRLFKAMQSRERKR